MTNDLKNFLEGETDKFISDNSDYLYHKDFTRIAFVKWLENHDTRLINFVLDLMVNEIEKKYDIDYNMQDEPFRSNNLYNEALDDISTVINKLKEL